MSADWEELLHMVRRPIGLAADGPYADGLHDRSRRVARVWGAETSQEALAKLAARPERLDELIEAVTVPETYFLREPARLRFVIAVVVPELLERRPPGHALRVWSAGCSSGEEPLTLAILLRGARIGHAPILGTDVSRTALRKAELGVYGPWSFRGVPESFTRRHFQSTEGGLQALPELRERVAFERLNLVQDPYPTGMDLIVCRNVLLYLDAAAKTAVMRRMGAALAPGGWLMTAVTDPLVDDVAPLEQVATPYGVFYHRPGDRSPAVQSRAAIRPLLPAPRVGSPSPRTRPRAHPEGRLPKRAGRSPAPPTLPGVAPAALAATVPANAQGAQDVRALIGAGRLWEAEDLVSQVVARVPLDPEIRYLQGLLAMEAGRVSDALSAANAACYLDPGLVAAHLLRGHAHQAAGQQRRAWGAWQRARTLLRRVDPLAPVPLTDGAPAGRLLALLDSAADRALAPNPSGSPA